MKFDDLSKQLSKIVNCVSMWLECKSMFNVEIDGKHNY